MSFEKILFFDFALFMQVQKNIIPMKEMVFSTLTVALLLIFIGCNKSQAGEVTITGQFVGNIPEQFTYTVPVNGVAFEGFFERGSPDSLGGFEINLVIDRPALLYFRYLDSPPLIIEPNQHYEIILNLSQDRKLSIEGDLGIVQNFFNELPHETPISCLYSFGEDVSSYNIISHRLKSELAKEEKGIQSLFLDGKITENLKELLITERRCYYKSALGVLAGTNRFAFLRNNEPIPNDLSQIWYEALDLDVIENDYLLQSYYSWFLIELKIWQNIYTKFDVEQITQIRAEKRKANLIHSHNVELAKEFISGDILQFYLAGLFYHQMMRREIDVNLQAIYEQFKIDYPESEYIPFVKEIYSRMINN
jgi:hypothetical protein